MQQALSPTVPVLSVPAFSLTDHRERLEVPEGATVEEIVARAQPVLFASDRERLQVSLVSPAGQRADLAHGHWRQVRPHAGTLVAIRMMPAGNDTLQSILLTVVSVASVALGQFYAPILFGAGTLGATVGAAVITGGALLLGGLLVNALFPPTARPQASRQRDKPTYQISGWSNAYSPGSAVPAVMGRHRFAPPFAAPSFTEIVGDRQYVRAMFNLGYGPLELSDMKLGETPLSAFDEVTIETRLGTDEDDPVSLYPQQVIEEQQGVELRRDLPRNTSGDVIAGPSTITPVSRFTAADTSEAGIIIGFPAGLIAYNDAGDAQTLSVSVRIQYRPSSGGAWTQVSQANYSARRSEPFFRYCRFAFPSRGRWEVEVTRMTEERTDARKTDRVSFVALQSFRPEYPLAFDKPLALVALRVKATHQLQGQLDTFNCLATRVCLDWDSGTQSWVERATRNPASLFRYVLQQACAFPASDAELDLDNLQDWHDYCADQSLKYDRIHDFTAGQYEVLSEIAAAGRAAPRFDGEKWGVVIDRPQQIVVDHINPLNSSGFGWQRSYFRPPDALMVPFLDETADYAARERIVPWPGQAGNIEVVEEFPIVGKTDPDEIWIEARRRQYEVLQRADRFNVTQQGGTRVATRGDLVKLSYDVLVSTQAARRVLSVHGDMVALDGPVTMEAGQSYASRYQLHDEDENGRAVTTNVLRPVKLNPGAHAAITLEGSGDMPKRNTILHFGLAGTESTDVRVKSVEAGEELSSVLTLVPAAEGIETLLENEVIPPWDGRVGGSISNDTTAPAVPVVTGVELTSDGATVLLSPGDGSPVQVATYVVQHRLVGAGSWTVEAAVPAGAGSVTIGGYDPADDFEFQVQAVSLYAVGSAFTTTISRTVPVPDAAPDPNPSATATGGLGAAGLAFSTPSTGGPFHETVIYRTTVDDFGTASEIARVPGLPGSTYNHVDGDATPANLVANSGFDSADDWTEGTGWAIAAGVAEKTPGSAGNLSQAIAFTGSETYRFRLDISGRTAGSVTIALRGGTDAVGPSFSANGTVYGEVVAGAGNTSLSIEADSAFDGAIDNVMLFKETPASLPQGTYYYFLTAANADDNQSAPIATGAIPVT